MGRIEGEIPGFELSEGGSMTRTPIQYQERPYLLHSNVILFHDWRYIREGVARWKMETGDKVERHPPEMPVEAIRWWGGPDAPRGIRLRAIPARKSDPVFRAGSPWEGLGNVTVIRDSGVYRPLVCPVLRRVRRRRILEQTGPRDPRFRREQGEQPGLCQSE
jgi:hypothetical protein